MKSFRCSSECNAEMKKPKHKFRNKPESNRRTGVRCVCGCVLVAACVVFSVVVGVDAKVVGTGGEVYGDPAPGRSPGPPGVLFGVRTLSRDSKSPRVAGYKASSSSRLLLPGRLSAPPGRTRHDRSVREEMTSVVIRESGAAETSWCQDYSDSVRFVPGSTSDVFLKLTHPLFEAEGGIFPGITYKVVLTVAQEVKDLSLVSLSGGSTGEGFSTEDCLKPLSHHSDPSSLSLNWTLSPLMQPPSYNATFRGKPLHATRANHQTARPAASPTTSTARPVASPPPPAAWPTASPSTARPKPDFMQQIHAQYDATFSWIPHKPRIRYRIHEQEVYEYYFYFPITQDCTFRLKSKSANLTSSSLPEVFRTRPNCSVEFPRVASEDADGPGLVVSLSRLNVRCALGRLRLTPAGSGERVLCGKLEEIPTSGRDMYFRYNSTPVRLTVVGRPVFSLKYHLVDYCFNVTYTQKNHSFEINPSTELLCNYRILLPYGYRVSLNLRIGKIDSVSGSVTERQTAERLSVTTLQPDDPDPPCEGFQIRLWDGPTSWTHCAVSGDPVRELHVISRENRVSLRVTSRALGHAQSSLRVVYDSAKVPEVVQQCEWGWVALKQFCVRVVEERRVTWEEAEQSCVSWDGHLASIRSEQDQELIDNMLLFSPGYADDNAYWVGATDSGLEGDFRWVDGLPFGFTNWFPGWSQHNNVLKQPNDDFLSEEDCVELRRLYHHPGLAATAERLTESFMWNDRDCATRNYFICEKLQKGAEPLEELKTVCNRSLTLTVEQPRTSVTSPGFPRTYPDNAECHTLVQAPLGYRLVVEFDELTLEEERLDCSYDVLELHEPGVEPRRICGDWSERLKLLRYVTSGPQLTLSFLSDYSHHYGGFKARVAMEHANAECGDDRLQMFNGSCFLFVSYPEVTWQTAKQICKGLKAELASVHSPDEERFIVSKIRASREYSTNAIYWLGAQQDALDNWYWVDSTPMTYTAWLTPNNGPRGTLNCLSLQWMSSPTQMLPSSLYWQPQLCANVGGYICKKESQGVAKGLNLNATVNATEGRLTSPRYPASYHHNLDYWVRLVAPEFTRVVIHFSRLDLEPQSQCLYDYLELEDVQGPSEPPRKHRYCGHQDPASLERLHFVSESNEINIHFHSDYSVSASGFALSWRAVDVSGCPLHTLTAKEGLLTSPNYPHFLLDRLDCSTTILAPVGRRVWLQITDFDLEVGDSSLEVSLGDGTDLVTPFRARPHLSDGVFVSAGERVQLRLKTGDNPRGRGFKALYKSVYSVVDHRIIVLNNVSSGYLLHVNYPHSPPTSLDFTDRLVAPLGKSIHLQFYRAEPTFLEDEDGRGICPENRGVIEVRDNYADSNGTWWRLCETEQEVPPLAITSYLNSLQVRQINKALSGRGVRLNASVVLKTDLNYKSKLLQGSADSAVESCNPNPCLNGGKCVSSSSKKSCQCIGYFTGMFCALTLCELDPCLFGRCELTASGFRCHCNRGYEGEACDTKQNPCANNPCEGRGDCIERPDSTFHCRCHAWWEGAKCERRMLHIPYKPLSQRMLQEPFWLGLITVFVVLGVLGLFWCAKRHFPEKLEKLLAEEADRTRHCHISGRTASVRDQLTGTLYNTNPVSVPAAANAPPPRTLFGRLGIRKPSLLSLTGPMVPPHAAHTARTFSLDDLLKPPVRRSPSPRKKRVNSTPTKKNTATTAAEEKKMILQHLVAPAVRQSSMESVVGVCSDVEGVRGCDSNSAETSFTLNTATIAATAAAVRNQELKQEKKVTFARLLDKVSSEMSSGSELEGTNITVQPPSPCKDLRSPNSTSSNQGSDSLSSSEQMLAVHSVELVKRPLKLPLGPTKASSADSILAMFRNFTAVGGAGVGGMSPSTTPTASSPQDDVAGSDDSSSQTPVSSSSGPPDSPPFFSRKHTIQVSVMDPLSAQKNASNYSGGSNLLHPPSILLEVPNKCLSPIKEMPSPSPSPALTPIMPRHQQNISLHHCKPERLDVPVSVATNSLTIPTLTVQVPSPTRPHPPFLILPGSPPPHKEPPFPHRAGKLLRDLDKPTSLDLPVPPPLITVTCSMSEVESDAESPANKSGMNIAGGMCYLSPFSMCTRADRTTSESNLSSSGYSSMASPGPSRCGSNNPLCSDVEDPQQSRKPSPLLRTPRMDGSTKLDGCLRGRSDSETLSDDPQVESNDEGFGTDHLDEKIEGGELKSAKELEVFIGMELVETGKRLMGLPISPVTKLKHCSSFESNLEQKGMRKVKPCASVEAGLDCYLLAPPPKDMCKISLQLPSIVVDADPSGVDIHCSPVSSRSESPLSDKTGGMGRFSPMFYGRLTDSDGLYDCASSDCCKIAASRKPSGRRKERKRSKSPIKSKDGKDFITNVSQTLLDVPGKSESFCRHSIRNKPSPKRRVRTHSQVASSTSSSSSESINSVGDLSQGKLTPDGARSPERGWDKIESTWTSDSAKVPSNEASGEETGEEATVTTQMLPKSNKKISRMRTIGHQIRFLRRLEQSIRTSRWDSSEPDSPTREPLTGGGSRLSRLRATVSDEPLLSESDRAWRRVNVVRSGHTD